MKSLKVLACAACLLGTVSSVGFAKDVQTIAGPMMVPNNVEYDGKGIFPKLWY